MNIIKNQLLVPGLLIAAAVFLGLWMYSRAQGSVITVCAKHDGLMHVIGGGFKRTQCLQNETLLSWNTEGPPGPPGPQGPSGSTLHLFDANGQDLGILVGAEPYLEIFTLASLSFGLPFTSPFHAVIAKSAGAGSSPPGPQPLVVALTTTDVKVYKTYLPSSSTIALFLEHSRPKSVALELPLNGGVFFEGSS